MTFLPANVISDAFSGGPNLLTTDLAGYGILPPLWGIFDQDGNAVVTADSVLGVEYRQDWAVADYPQERGAFESYDKVAIPFEARVTFMSGGSFSNRQALLDSVTEIAGDLELYDVVTPEATYTNCNVTHYDYRRTEGNAGLIKVTVHLLEIRVSDATSLSSSPQPGNTAQPGGADTINDGQVQPGTLSTAQRAAVNSALTQQAIAAGA